MGVLGSAEGGCGAVLVTGGTGFVGSHTVAALLGEGHDVRLLIRDPRRVTDALTPGPPGLWVPESRP